MISDKREQVFVSSTYLDLAEERQAVIFTLLQVDCFPAGMELFPASNDEKWSLIKQVIDDSDYYLVVIGGRYGSVDDDGLSFTEKEFDYADETGKPILAFLHGNVGSIAAEKFELDTARRERLNAFRDKASKRMAKFWTNPAELQAGVAISMISIRKTHPAEGWIRASRGLTPELESELIDLRSRVVNLDVDAEKESKSEPESVYAEGTDVFQIKAKVDYWTQEDVKKNRMDSIFAKELNVTVRVTWDQIFSAISPRLVIEGSEVGMRTALSKLIRDNQGSIAMPPDVAVFSDLEATIEARDDVKIQLFSLGLIQQSQKSHILNDKNKYWTLTQKGRDHMFRLRAIRKPLQEA